MEKERMKELIEELAKETPRYAHNRKKFIPGTTQVLYSGPYWDHKELEMAMKALLTGAWLTSGEYVARFQNIFSKHFGVKYSHMVNSGSSANLVMIAALKKHHGWKDGDEIIVSPVGFPTTISAIVQNGLKPRFQDIELNTLNFETNNLPINDDTVGIFVSPVLGNAPDMDKLKRSFGMLIGDNCDSLGSKWNGDYLTNYYKAWSTSFYPAHHITTGEGGMVCTNDVELMKTARSISWWGRDCYCVGQANMLPCGTCGKRFDKWLDEDSIVDHKYVFTNMGYNLKPLDLQGAIGIAQMGKIEDIEALRRHNYKEISKLFLEDNVIEHARVGAILLKSDPCWFGVPIVCATQRAKESLVAHLEKHLIQTRGYFAGNILLHPAYKHLGDASKFPNANQALKRVFFLGCPPHYTEEIISYIGEVLRKWEL